MTLRALGLPNYDRMCQLIEECRASLSREAPTWTLEEALHVRNLMVTAEQDLIYIRKRGERNARRLYRQMHEDRTHLP